jgi:glyoxylase-like metal-dependent hydrolase (beta-lactamase superfamily II)
MTAVYEIYAVRYARLERTAAHNFIGGDEHDGPMPLDYYVWAIVGGGRTIVLDTGFDAAMARRRGREIVRPVGEGLKAIGVAPDQVEEVVISHMHYDHAGNHDLFPRARYHLQDAEMAYCTGRCMCHRHGHAPFEAEDVAAMVARIFAGRAVFHDGDEEIAPGVTLHRLGGHTPGLQVMRVATARGWVVLASDATHFYANLEQGRPFPIFENLSAYLEGHRSLRRLASTAGHIVPGHDPLVLDRFPPARTGLAGVARVDLPPRS